MTVGEYRDLLNKCDEMIDNPITREVIELMSNEVAIKDIVRDDELSFVRRAVILGVMIGLGTDMGEAAKVAEQYNQIVGP